MNKRNYVLSGGFGILALAVGVLCHRLAPGLGLVLMPMFWPLAVLASLVPRRFSVTTAALVPFVSFLLTGMPVVPFVVALKFALLAATSAWCFRRLALKRVVNKRQFIGGVAACAAAGLLIGGAFAADAAPARFEIADRAVTGDVTVINIPWAFIMASRPVGAILQIAPNGI